MARDQVIKAMVTYDEKRVLVLISQQDRKLLSETLRDLIRREAQDRGLWPVQERREVSDEH